MTEPKPPGASSGDDRVPPWERPSGSRPAARPTPPPSPTPPSPPRRPSAGSPTAPSRPASAQSAPPASADEAWTEAAPRRTAAVAEPPPERDGDAYPDEAPRGARRRRWPKVLLGALLVLVLLGGAATAAGWFWVQDKIDPPGEPGEVVQVTVPEGASTDDVAQLLEAEGIISSASVFQWWLRVEGAPEVQAGVYQLRTSESFDGVVEALEAGPAAAPFAEVTVPEGLSVFASPAVPAPGPVVDALVEGVPRFSADAFMDVLVSGQVASQYAPEGNANLEGLLFPDTYRVEEEQTEADVVAQMVGQMDAVAAELGIDQAPTTVGLTPYEVLIVASLIERETKVPEERAMVARVIYNRLDAGNPLGIDASTQYALGRPPETTADFDPASPYNLRANQGLPPTPIGVPGRASIEAALNPAEGDWFYYVLESQDGTHFFTASEAEFLEAKERCQEMGLC